MTGRIHFRRWQKDINYDTKLFDSVLQGYEFSEKFADPKQAAIGFGEFGGAPKMAEHERHTAT